MPVNAKLYSTIVTVLGPCALLVAVWDWQITDPARFGFFLTLAILASSLIYRLYAGRINDGRVHAEELTALHLRTIETLALAIEAKDNTTHDHLKRVQVYALEAGKELGLPEIELEALRAASVLHDIGKLAVPEHIISKPGKLTPEEFAKMKIHPVVGAEILERVQFPYPVVPIVRAHHEKWNGTGYPAGLKGEEIPIGARILSVVDTFDALASDRQYRRALPLDQAMAKIEQDAGRSFDPQIVGILKRRYVEWEKKAQSQTQPSIKLSKDVRVERGDAPAAGFDLTRPLGIMNGEEPPDESLQSLAAACAHVSDIVETSPGGKLLDLEEWLALMAVRLNRLVPHDSLAVYLIQEDKLIPRYVSGENCRMFSALRIPVGQGLSGWVFENRRPVLNGNPSVEPGYLNDPNVFSTLRSALAVPLEVSSAAIGVLTFYGEGRECFTREHLRVVQSIAPKLALSLGQTNGGRRRFISEAVPANAEMLLTE